MYWTVHVRYKFCDEETVLWQKLFLRYGSKPQESKTLNDTGSSKTTRDAVAGPAPTLKISDPDPSLWLYYTSSAPNPY